jgi:hypothetical protein
MSVAELLKKNRATVNRVTSLDRTIRHDACMSSAAAPTPDDCRVLRQDAQSRSAMMTLSNVDIVRSRASADESQLALRVATALLITVAAAFVLIYAGLWANALPVDADLLQQLY